MDPAELTTVEHEKLGFIRCNAIGHAWFDYDSSHTPKYGTPFTVRCERCGTERRESLTPQGELIPGTRHYFHPDHYKYAKGTKPTRADFRRMLLAQRLQEKRQARRRATA